MKFQIELRLFLLFGSILLTTGCATLQPVDFKKSQTRFELDHFFDGHTRSWGVFENMVGQPRSTFVCNSFGRRTRNGTLLLHQQFTYSNKRPSTRDWLIQRVDLTHWKATASDMVGTASGEGNGNAFCWEYTLSLNKENPLATVHVRQWMYQVPDTRSVMTRLLITKFGIPISEVSEVIYKVPGR